MQFRIFSRQVLDISRAKWYEFMKFSWTFFLKKKIEMNAEFFLEKKQVLNFSIKKVLFYLYDSLKKNLAKFFIHFVPFSNVFTCFRKQVHVTYIYSKILDKRHYGSSYPLLSSSSFYPHLSKFLYFFKKFWGSYSICLSFLKIWFCLLQQFRSYKLLFRFPYFLFSWLTTTLIQIVSVPPWFQ